MDPLTAALNAAAAIAKLIDDVVLYQTMVLDRADDATAKALAEAHLKERERMLAMGDPFFDLVKKLKPPKED